MISAPTSSTASSGHHAIRRDARIADLTKQVAELREELAKAKDTKPEQLAGLKSNAISQDIASTQAQIEKMALESQLSRLNLISNSTESAISSKRSENIRTGNGATAGNPDSPAPPAQGSFGEPPRSERQTLPDGLPLADPRKHPDTTAHKLYQDAGGAMTTSHGSLVNIQA